ncbi:MAG: MFS transporter [Vicinamibacteria bacterium]|nr:MFS transporter [Vicinamibacteria bacterium]
MFWTEATPPARRALLAASAGWMLDAMDVLLYAFVLDHVRAEFGIDDRTSGLLLALPLAASAVGGVLFGWVADRLGRTRALMASILVYSVATAACGLVSSVWQLAAARLLVGLGMGGEWATGAALVAETWPAAHRGKALGLMQSAWAVGYAAAAALNAVVLPAFGWRAVFLAGLLPAMVTLWIRRSVEESPLWLAGPRHVEPAALAEVLTGGGARLTWTITAMNAATMFAWWGLFSWIPSFLARPLDQGGAGLSLVRSSTWIVLMQVGMWLGYVSFGFIADRVGRKRTYVTYLITAAVLVPIYATSRHPALLLALGPIVAFFGTGYFSGFGAVTAEIFPTRIRATAQGLTYNLGRGISAAAPFTVGALATVYGLGAALLVTSLAFLVAASLWVWIPETRGRTLL